MQFGWPACAGGASGKASAATNNAGANHFFKLSLINFSPLLIRLISSREVIVGLDEERLKKV
jgi:hypothetical protein